MEHQAVPNNDEHKSRTDSPTYRDIERVEHQLLQLRDLINQINVKISGTNSDIAPALSAIEKVSQKADTISKKADKINRNVPPLATLITIAGLILGVLGWSYNDLRSIHKPIEEAARGVENSAKDIGSTVGSVKIALVSLNEVSAKLAPLTEKVATLDESLARLLFNINQIQGIAQRPIISSATPDPGDGESILLEMMQSADRPEYISYLARARQAFKKADYATARMYASKAKDLDNDKKEGVYDAIISQSYYKEGKYREAIGGFENIIATGDKSATIYNNLGSAYFALSREEKNPKEKKRLAEKALSAQTKAIELEPSSPETVVNVSIVLNSLNRYAEAEEILTKWKGEDASIYYQLGATRALRSNIAASIQALSMCFQLDKAKALNAAADEDFALLRSNDSFRDLLQRYLGDKLMKAIKLAWAKHKAGEPE
jgi:tetratricopeptide (TPR) repeat protein